MSKKPKKELTYNVQLMPMDGQFVNAFLWMEGQPKPVGYAHLLFVGEFEEKECMLLNIHVIYKYRRQGAATAFITGIKNECHAITTDYTTTAGKQMCLKNGFMFEEISKGRKVLVWRKPTSIITNL